MLERPQIDRMFVTKCAVEAGAVHAGGGGKLIERRAGKAGRPERLDGLRQSNVRHIGGRATTSFWLFLYHLAKKSVDPTIFVRNSTKINRKGDRHGLVFRSPRLLDGH